MNLLDEIFREVIRKEIMPSLIAYLYDHAEEMTPYWGA
jgi:hypothetical protein